MSAFRPVLTGLCLFAVSLAASAAPPAKPAAVALADRIGWGGGPPVADPAQYLRDQLHPSNNDGLPPEIAARIAAMPISRMTLGEIAEDVGASRLALQQQRQMAAANASSTAQADPQRNPAQMQYRQKLTDYARQAAERSLLRDIYSKNQLREQLVWFWFNHFNVNQRKGVIAAMVGDYEEQAIRPHVLGKFRDLLIATAFHPAMLQYLDNQQNAAGHINENFAREIMELHTMGVGSGYTQKDVQELARILTGVGINFGAQARPRLAALALRAGADGIAFAPGRHDFGDKQFLGQTIKGSGADEAVKALTMLSRQPATARFVSKKLAEFFCCDAPPDRLVAAMAATFLKSDGDITQVLTTLFNAPDFTANLGSKFKDPVHYAVSAVRAAYGETPIQNLTPVMNWLMRMGEPLYGHETPDGYALTADAWSGPGAMETRFEIATVAGAGRPSLLLADSTPQGRGGRGAMPTDAQLARLPQTPPPEMKNSPYVQALTASIAPATRDALAKARNPAEWNMLLLSSPEFMYR
ncbi:MAG: DUF1800 domain-containing protein [Alphaproteobacteria bacterium]|nr:DUF1800 domain-containing protein [Alphaproteobacteria bacterium]